MSAKTSPSSARRSAHAASFSRIAVGINGLPEGEDALALGAALGNATQAELMLVAVHPEVLVVLPVGMDWRSLREAARGTLRDARDRMVPNARTAVESDLSVPRALRRVVRRDHRDLLVLGSSRHARKGHVRIGKRTRQILEQSECAVAIAARGMHEHERSAIARVGVGYDGSPEARAALDLAAALARATGAELDVRAVLDDRLPPIGWSSVGRGAVSGYWEELLESEIEAVREDAQAAARATGVSGQVNVYRGRPADRLLELSHEVDLLIIGSRRWGPVARLMLGSTGEAVLHDAACSVVAVPRPRS